MAQLRAIRCCATAPVPKHSLIVSHPPLSGGRLPTELSGIGSPRSIRCLIIPLRQLNHDSGDGEFLIRISTEQRFASYRNRDSQPTGIPIHMAWESAFNPHRMSEIRCGPWPSIFGRTPSAVKPSVSRPCRRIDGQQATVAKNAPTSVGRPDTLKPGAPSSNFRLERRKSFLHQLLKLDAPYTNKL